MEPTTRLKAAALAFMIAGADGPTFDVFCMITRSAEKNEDE